MPLFLKNFLFTLFVPGTIAGFIPLFLFPHASPVASPRSFTAGLFVLFGSSLYAWSLRDFAGTGGGTPSPVDPPKVLVVRGPYRYTRNPMYLGVLTVLGGWALLFGSAYLAVYGLGVAACVHGFVRLYEEPHLRRVFGPSYEQYCSEVGRWLPRGARRCEGPARPEGGVDPVKPKLEAVHPVLMVRDVESAIRFYERLGFTAVFRDAPSSPKYAAVRRDDVELHLQWHDASAWDASGDRPTHRFVVDFVDALSAELAAVPNLDRTEVRDTPWGTREFHVRDPDGNGLQFYRDRPA